MKKVILLVFAICLMVSFSFAVDRNVGAGQTYATIQAAIDASTSGDVINVYPGTYNQDEANGWDPVTGGTGTSNFNIFVNKSVTIQGVTAGGVPITNYSGVLAFVIPKRNTPSGNASTFFIQANNVIISGLDVTAFDDPAYNFKTISVIGENVTIKNCALHARDQVSSIYMYDPRYVSGTNTSYIQSYRFEVNSMDAGGIYASGIRFSSGAGWTGSVVNRVIIGNTITGGSYGIEFVGPQADPWDVYPVGAATITNNSFSGQDKGSLVAWGEYQSAVGYGNIDWNGIWTNNTFDKAVIVKTSGGDVRYYDLLPQFKYIRGIYSAIRRYPINNVAQAGDIINVAEGTYEETGQIVINKNLSIVGENKASTIVKTLQNTGGSGDAQAWFLIMENKNLNLSNLTIDGSGYNVRTGLRFRGNGTVDNCIIKNIAYPGYQGFALALTYESTSSMNVTVSNCEFYNFGRVGVHVDRNGPTSPSSIGTLLNNTFVGKGPGDHLDYAIEVEGGANAIVTNNTISNCLGIALSDASTSAGVLVTTYFDSGTQATLTGNTIINNSTGIAVGYNASDASTVVAHNNNISNNSTYGISSTNPLVNAENNWWGSATGPFHATLNPLGTGNPVSDNIDFNPWIEEEIVIVSQTTPTVYNFPLTGVKMEFTTLPLGGGTVTVTRYNEAPTPFPSGYTNVGMWLDITSTMPNYSFDVTVYVDVFGIPGFDATTTVMYKNSTGNWLAVPGGTYLASDPMFGGHPSFSFVTNHFTPFTFINTPAAAYNVYLSSSASASAGFIYPNDSWGTTAYEPPYVDWDFTAPITLYIVPAVGSVFGASDITVQWDNTMFTYGGVDKTGGIYDNPAYQFFYNQLGTTNSVTINASRTDNNNFTIGANNYIAKLNLNLLKPGFGPVSFTGLDFRAFDGLGGQLGVFVTGNNGQVKSYLGDVASTTPASTSTGDGLVNFDDLSLWSVSYWSGVGGFGLANYKVKYDVGPTSTNNVYGIPAVDEKIQFEDLVIFSMSYGFSASDVYPKIEAEPTAPVELQLGEPIIAGSQTRIPLFISGGVQNVRAMSLTFAGQFGKLVSVEKGSLLTDFTNPVIVMNNVDGNQVYVDLAVFGAEEVCINTEGEVLTLVFEGNTEINISSAEVRNILNGPMAVNISGSEGLVPSEFALMQNYPNPFNPTTTINYNLPKQAMVEISIFNALGEKVATVVNEIKEAGKHTVEFNATGYSSGIYFYQIKANDFVSVKKMILMK